MEVLKDNTQTVEQRQVQDKKKIQKLGSMRKIPGLTLFEINVKNFKIKPAEFKESTVRFDNEDKLSPKIINKLVSKEHCFYIQALNAKNALRKFKKLTSKA